MPKMGVAMTMNREEKKWRTRDDARALAKAKEIQDDPKRMKEAQNAAKTLLAEEQKYLEEQQEKLTGLKRLAKQASK